MAPLLERLTRRIGVSQDRPLGLTTRCREWTGAVDRFGHGRVKVDGKNVHVRRAILAAHGVDLAPDEHVIALCQNTRCVNHKHFVVGTVSEARAFGRGSRVNIATLLIAKHAIENGEATATQLAGWLEISEVLLKSAIARVRWVEPAFQKAA
jgi:hypothetical protein